MEKIKSVKFNFIMNFILTASNFIFPLITFPYVSRILLASGNGKIAFVTSVANYFSMVASLGIPTYGIRACASIRDDKKSYQKLYMN
ncbi:oligosaccharide flippase family protein [Allocoprobacillus halotolerans]|uniref:Oligosaccharide flippase family protein n=1 Tax=Allocoprobacillus halotolerans TaxID=2944914 RepID=A0ABY5HYE7_9FIRM|nr:oligosaccharide flippase family protein [Allocoprobacillus halotolerans]UTY38096.1 oligosaccharide flippase family protein [Allocoprobacillus halotolerans]